MMLSRLLSIYSECSPLPLSTIVTFLAHVQLPLLHTIHLCFHIQLSLVFTVLLMAIYFCGYLSLGYNHACVYFLEWGFPSRTHPSLCDSCDKYPNLVTGKQEQELGANNVSNSIYSSGRQKA